MAEIDWTQKAASQFEMAVKWKRNNQGVKQAKSLKNKVFEGIERLTRFPESGPLEPWLAHKKITYQFLLVGKYKIIYRYMKSSEKVYIVRFFHTARNPDTMLD